MTPEKVETVLELIQKYQCSPKLLSDPKTRGSKNLAMLTEYAATLTPELNKELCSDWLRYRAVLEHIKQGRCDNPKTCAREALLGPEPPLAY